MNKRTIIGVLACLASTAFILWQVHRGENPTWACFQLSGIWGAASYWVAGLGPFVRRSLPEVQDAAKRGELKLTGIALWMNRLALALTVGWIVLLFS